MSSAGVQSWTLTAADNTTINGINIAENCPAAGINNAVRQAMSSVMQELVYQGTDISASVSMSLAGVDWRFMAVTGSASIIHVGTGRAGLVRNVIWNSPSTLVGSSNILTDGGGNIVTATNDVTMFTSLGSGAWRAVHFPVSPTPSFSANKNGTDQTGIAASTNTKITFTTEAWDTGGMYDAPNSKFLPTIAGTYQINAAVLVTGGVADGATYEIAVFKNGSLEKWGIDTPGGSATFIGCAVSALVQMNGSTDYVEIYFFGSGAGTKTINGAASQTYFQGVKVA